MTPAVGKPTASLFAESLREMQQGIDTRLEAVVSGQPGLPDRLREAMAYSLLAPAKRLRPALVLLACEASGGVSDLAWPAACAVEMIHTYSLIHDDLPAMDDDDLRRGRPTCHKVFGEALAILAGDALLTQAFEVLGQGYPGSVGALCCADLARAAGPAGMVGGQVADLEWEAAASDPGRAAGRTLENLEALHARKTGALIGVSLRLGVRAAFSREDRAPPHELLDRFDGYGRCLGLAFQITDDLLDVEGQADRAGKRVQKDAARGKLTYPGILGIAESRLRAERLGREAMEYLAPLGPAASRLLALVSFVLERDR